MTTPVTYSFDTLLRRIIDELITPMSLVDPTVRSGPHSRWLCFIRTIKSLTLVCRAWNSVATLYLYDHVLFRRVGQIPALIRTLEAKPGHHGLINQLTFACYVPVQWDQITNDGISYLLGNCSKLRSLTFHAIFTQWLTSSDEAGMWRFDVPSNIMRSAISVTSIKYYYPSVKNERHEDIVAFHAFSPIPNLTSLTLIMEEVSSTSCLLRLQACHLNAIRAHQGDLRDIFNLTALNPTLTSLLVDTGLLFPENTLPEQTILSALNFVIRFPDLYIILNDHEQSLAIRLLRLLPENFTGRLDIWAPSEVSSPSSDYYLYDRDLYNRPEFNKPYVRFIHYWLRDLPPDLTLVHTTNDTGDHDWSMIGTRAEGTKRVVFRREECWDMRAGKAYDVSDPDYDAGGSSSNGERHGSA